jgi:hypothetical protein
MWYWRRIEKIKWSEKVTNEQALERIGEKRTLLNNILRRKANWFDHILRRNCLLRDAIEGQMTEMKVIGRRTQFLDDLRNQRRYWELKEEAEDRKNMESKPSVFHKSMNLLISSILNNNDPTEEE